MPVLVVADVPGVTAAEDRDVAAELDYPSRAGFRLRLTGPSATGRRILTLWDSIEDFEAFRDGPLAEVLHEGDLPVPRFEYWPIESVVEGGREMKSD